jgi:hypothetical protein
MKPTDEEIKTENERQQKANLEALERQQKAREEADKRNEERRKKEAAEASAAAKAEDAERRKLRATCAAVYQNTADKRMGDLTVKEDQQVKACQALGLYPPR